jgi:1-acyl-sn-glycerol-3-phosphate acyltransferase
MRVPPRPSPVYLAIGLLTWPLVKFLYRLRWHGLENLPRDSGYVLAANHTSNFDPWPLGLPLFPRRFLRFMGKAELFWPPLGWLIQSAGAFKVRRGEGDTEAIETAVALVRDGHVVVMFPEGTRRTKGIVKKFESRPRTGAARIAIEAGVPLVPAAIEGTDRLARLGPLRVAYGLPLAPEGTPQELTDKLMAEIDRLKSAL